MPGKAPKERFSDKADAYARYRPSYPSALLDELERAVYGAAGRSVADIGSGTGIFSSQLLDRGFNVYAVEPNQDMRDAAESALGGQAGFSSLPGEGARTGIPSAAMDAVVCAQAFHWFADRDSVLEMYRIAKPGAPILLTWNYRPEAPDGFQGRYESLINAHCPDYTATSHKNLNEAQIAMLFPERRIRTFRYDNSRSLDFDSLKGSLESCSYCVPADHPNHAPLMTGLREAFDTFSVDGSVRVGLQCVGYFLEER